MVGGETLPQSIKGGCQNNCSEVEKGKVSCRFAVKLLFLTGETIHIIGAMHVIGMLYGDPHLALNWDLVVSKEVLMCGNVNVTFIMQFSFI
jgi:hypothetical protein